MLLAAQQRALENMLLLLGSEERKHKEGLRRFFFLLFFLFPLSLRAGWSWKSELGSWSLQRSSGAPNRTSSPPGPLAKAS